MNTPNTLEKAFFGFFPNQHNRRMLGISCPPDNINELCPDCWVEKTDGKFFCTVCFPYEDLCNFVQNQEVQTLSIIDSSTHEILIVITKTQTKDNLEVNLLKCRKCQRDPLPHLCLLDFVKIQTFLQQTYDV